MPYGEAVGSLMYLMVGTRPDIAFSVSRLARYVGNPTTERWKAVKQLLRYVSGTASYGICYGCDDSDLTPVCYSDSDWGSDLESRRSTIGWIIMMSGSPICWGSKQQEVVALSSTEAEYVALCTAGKEVVWTRRLLENLNVIKNKLKLPHLTRVDNQGSMDLAHKNTSSKRTKHENIRYQYIRQLIRDKCVTLEYCPTEDRIAHMMTKPLNRIKLQKFANLSGLKHEISSEHATEGGCWEH